MKEWITGRNPVYETLRAKRKIFRLMVASGAERTAGRGVPSGCVSKDHKSGGLLRSQVDSLSKMRKALPLK